MDLGGTLGFNFRGFGSMLIFGKFWDVQKVNQKSSKFDMWAATDVPDDRSQLLAAIIRLGPAKIDVCENLELCKGKVPSVKGFLRLVCRCFAEAGA